MIDIDSQNDVAALSDPSSQSSHDAAAHAVVLAIEGLITDAQFMALTGQSASEITALLANPEMLLRVQELSLELQNKGTLARLEALRHVRAAVQVTASILHNEEFHPGQRLAAAAELHRVAGTSKPPAEEAAERHTIVINLGNERPIVIAGPSVSGDDSRLPI